MGCVCECEEGGDSKFCNLPVRPIHAFTQEYALTNSGDWRNYAFFNDLHYVRNLVALDEDFELIVGCSPVRNCEPAGACPWGMPASANAMRLL